MANIRVTTISVLTTVYQLTLTKEELVFIRMITGDFGGLGVLRVAADKIHRVVAPMFTSEMVNLDKPIKTIMSKSEEAEELYLNRALTTIIEQEPS